MEIPDLVQQALGDEDVRAGVSLGDEDAVCLTPTRTIVYHGESLLSDESVAEYSHDVERVSVKESRRKTKFVLEYVDGTESFTVPANRGENVLEVLLEGVLRVDGVIDDGESIAGVYRFSELTLVITDQRLIKHIGQVVWDDDFETYPYADVTDLEFEEASVATNVSLVVDGRPQRVKVPNDEGPVVRRTLEGALFDFYDVASLEEFNHVVADSDGEDPDPEPAGETGGDDLEFGSDIDPLVTSGPDEDRQDEVDAASDPLLGDRDGDPQSTERARDEGRANTGGQASGPDPSRATTDEASRDESDAGRGAGSTQRDASAGPQSNSADRTDPETDRTRADAAETARSDRSDGRRDGSESTADPARRSESTGRAAPEAAEPSAGETGAREPGSRQADASGSRPADSTDQQGSDDAAAEEWFESDGPTGETEDVAADVAAQLGYEPASREELEAVTEQLDDLTDAVDRQNELLKRQHRAIKQLVEELRDG